MEFFIFYRLFKERKRALGGGNNTSYYEDSKSGDSVYIQ